MHNNDKSYECCIIGSGPAGLGVALELVKHGINNILIVDKNSSAGGLSRTNIFDGVRFDIGPHRFHTSNEEINKIWHDTLGGDFHLVSRMTRIFYKNKYFYYPLKAMNVLSGLGLAMSIRALASFIAAQIGKKKEAVSFEEWIVQRFGHMLYEDFFKVYTEKVWGIPCSQIDAQWASQRISGLNVWEAVKGALFCTKSTKIKTLVGRFNYPILGAGQMYEAISDKLVSQGVQVSFGSRAVSFNRKENSIQSVDIIGTDGRKSGIFAKHFFSSIPLADFFQLLSPQDSEAINNFANSLQYRDHIIVNLLVGRQKLIPDQWIYIHSPEFQLARMVNFNNFSNLMLGDKKGTALGVEYFVSQGKGLSNATDEVLKKLAVSELARLGILEVGEVENAWVVREQKAYPTYNIGFKEPCNALKSRIAEFNNFSSIGRAGTHTYNNQDDAMMSGILSARSYLGSNSP